MEESQIAKSLSAFQGEMPEIKLDSTVTVKTKTGGSYKFKYASLSNILKHTLPVLSKHGLSITQTFVDSQLITTLYDKSSETISSAMPINFASGTMQEIGSRITYAKRYSLTALLGICGEEDDDANITDGNNFTTGKPQGKIKTETQSKAATGEISGAQWEYIRDTGKKKDLTEPEVIKLVTWVAKENNISPRHWKISKILLPLENFEAQLEKYLDAMQQPKDSAQTEPPPVDNSDAPY